MNRHIFIKIKSSFVFYYKGAIRAASCWAQSYCLTETAPQAGFTGQVSSQGWHRATAARTIRAHYPQSFPHGTGQEPPQIGTPGLIPTSTMSSSRPRSFIQRGLANPGPWQRNTGCVWTDWAWPHWDAGSVGVLHSVFRRMLGFQLWPTSPNTNKTGNMVTKGVEMGHANGTILILEGVSVFPPSL